MKAAPVILACASLALPAQAEERLRGKSYIIELTSSQYASGYGAYLVPPLTRALSRAGLRGANGPGADVVVNIRTESDVGRWVTTGGGREWVHTVKIMVGISPADTVLPQDGTPWFGVTAVLETPNPDREDELACLIGLATRTAVANWQPEGQYATDGSACLRGK